jgi:myo-inositol 2-dehydrogenase/D-chiro-inositol 1-dehydrogenase
VLADGADAVLLGIDGSEADRLEKLRLLAQEGVATIFVHPQTVAALAYYELDMHRQATNVRLVPYEPSRHDPLLAELRGDADSGPLEQIVFERRAVDRSRVGVLRQLACDLGTIRRLAGEVEKVSALGTIEDERASGHLGVQMTAGDGTLVRWSIGPAVGADDVRLMIVGSRGQTSISIEADGRRLVGAGNAADESRQYSGAEVEQAAAEAVVAALGDTSHALWRDALADLEVVEAVERSLRRGRTVELFHEEASEQGTFKGIMAAGGCLLLLLSIGLAITATIVGKFRLWIANAWPFVLLAILVFFLLLQLLRFVFPPSAAAGAREDRD